MSQRDTMGHGANSQLGEYFNNETFSDFTIVCAGREYKVAFEVVIECREALTTSRSIVSSSLPALTTLRNAVPANSPRPKVVASS